jgi:hypothetical protein
MRPRYPRISAELRAKKNYVKAQAAAGQPRPHACHWPGCELQVPPAMWGCKPHWFALPRPLRNKVWAAYRPGQEIDGSPSDEYLAVVAEVNAWIRENGGVN